MIRVDGARAPIAGSVEEPGVPPREFEGWLELLTALELAQARLRDR